MLEIKQKLQKPYCKLPANALLLGNLYIEDGRKQISNICLFNKHERKWGSVNIKSNLPKCWTGRKEEENIKYTPPAVIFSKSISEIHDSVSRLVATLTDKCESLMWLTQALFKQTVAAASTHHWRHCFSSFPLNPVILDYETIDHWAVDNVKTQNGDEE